MKVAVLEVVPNPVESIGTIILPADNYMDVRLYLSDIKGSKIDCPIRYEKGKIFFEKGNLSKGAYIFVVREKGFVVDSGKILIL